MSALTKTDEISHTDRARRAGLSCGGSGDATKASAAKLLQAQLTNGRLIDVGCGTGGLRKFLTPELQAGYVGTDIVQYDGFPHDATFVRRDLESEAWQFEGAPFDAAVAVEVIEHVENPREFMRSMVDLVRPGGIIVVTTPNQLSLRAKASLVTKNIFPAFREANGLYPSHLTALLEIDLRRIFHECGLLHLRVAYSNSGRAPFVRRRWPARLGFRGRAFSDNIAVSGVWEQPSLP